MSQPETHAAPASTDTPESGYSRENFWGRDHDDSDHQTTTNVADGEPIAGYRRIRAEWIAHRILKESSRKLCGKTMEETGIEIDLTDPCIYPPDDPVADQRHARRYNDENGYISGPHDTWVELADRTKADFMALVEELCAMWRQRLDLSDDDLNSLREAARERKCRQDMGDQEIVATLLLAVRAQGGPTEYFD